MSVVGIPQDKISGEAVEAAARVLYGGHPFPEATPWERLSELHMQSTIDYWMREAAPIVGAAVPYIEAGLRAKIAAEIETEQYGLSGGLVGDFGVAYNAGIRAAARVARGTQEATK